MIKEACLLTRESRERRNVPSEKRCGKMIFDAQLDIYRIISSFASPPLVEGRSARSDIAACTRCSLPELNGIHRVIHPSATRNTASCSEQLDVPVLEKAEGKRRGAAFGSVDPTVGRKFRRLCILRRTAALSLICTALPTCESLVP